MNWKSVIKKLSYQKKLSYKEILSAIILIGLIIGLGYFSRQDAFVSIIIFYLPFFLIYTSLAFFQKMPNLYFLLLIAILLRFLLLFAFPNLSDDIYRFVWDGHLMLNGINPFNHTPIYYIENQIPIEGITSELFNNLNSAEYFTIYPPIAQTLFACSVWLFPNSVFWNAFVMKLFLFLCEIGSIILIIKLLKRWNLPKKNVLIYALNPLIIIEITGNLHFEGAMIFFLLLAVWWILPLFFLKKKPKLNERKSIFLSALFFSFSIASKLLTLLFLPFFIKRLGWKKSGLYFSTIGVITLLLFFPLINGVFIENFGNSLGLYFQKFEFNASVYYLTRWIGYQVIGWNLIAVLGPSLSICTIIGILFLASFDNDLKKKYLKRISFLNKASWQSLPEKMLFAICIYLTFTTTVHPWYLALPILLCVFTRFRFPILWSGLIFMTYLNYNGSDYYENLWIVGLEYFLVFSYLIYELFFSYKIPSSPVSSPH